jgi:hypothetical protein
VIGLLEPIAPCSSLPANREESGTLRFTCRAHAIVHVVPALPSIVNGLGDYAVALAAQIAPLGCLSTFVAAGPAAGPVTDGTSSGRPVIHSAAPEPRALAATLDRTAASSVILHFSGYGYARWALCSWLTEGLARWKAAAPDRHLVVMFHELYASGPPWRASFWTSRPQRRNARRLAGLADHIVCGYQLIGDRLKAWLPSRPVHVLPVFSNVGEIDQPQPLAGRDAVAIVFGGRRRAAVYQRGDQLDPAVLDRLGIERIVDIGPPIPTPPAFAGRPVEGLGILPPDEVSRCLAAARLGLADYPRHVAAKSGILAAYHAHGLLAFNLTDRGTPMDGLVEGEHFVGRRTMRSPALDLGRVAANGHRWYRRHDRAHAAALFGGLLHQGTGA